MSLDTKVCGRCSEDKPTADYLTRKRKGRVVGLHSYCKACSRTSHKEWLYGMPKGDYDRMVNEQRGCCLVCKFPAPLVVDHSHSTGEVRGLLCHGCNTGIGLFKEDPTRLAAAIAYLGGQ